MASIVHSVDIDRGADEVFAYVTKPSRFTEWQAAVVDAHAEDSGPLQKGSRLVMTPRMKCYKSAPSSANLRSVARETAGPTRHTPPQPVPEGRRISAGNASVDSPVAAVTRSELSAIGSR